jgi:hypothetical protein
MNLRLTPRLSRKFADRCGSRQRPVRQLLTFTLRQLCCCANGSIHTRTTAGKIGLPLSALAAPFRVSRNPPLNHAAAVMIDTYPELYAAAGIHSGLAYRCAHDLPSALAAMKGGKRARREPFADRNDRPTVPKRPLIVIHGDADATVHPSNGSELLREFGASTSAVADVLDSQAGGRACTRRRLTAAKGVDAEYWIIHGAPAWAGGSVRGTYTDANGPDASAEMVRFFLAHPQRH